VVINGYYAINFNGSSDDSIATLPKMIHITINIINKALCTSSQVWEVSIVNIAEHVNLNAPSDGSATTLFPNHLPALYYPWLDSQYI